MLSYLTRRVTYGVFTLVALSVIVFSLMQLTGGSPVDRLKANPRINQATLDQLVEFYGLDEPAHERYLTWAWSYVQGDWGISFQSTQPITGLVGDRVLATLRLTGTAMVIALALGIPFGVYQATRQYSLFDNVGTTVWFVAASIPGFIVALGMQIVFAVYLERWTGVKFFYAAGMNSANYGDLGSWAKLGDSLQHLALPAVSLALLFVAAYARFQRASMLEVLHSDYLRTARAKGLSRHRVVLKHALRNALLPVVTLLSLHVAGLVGGSIIIELIFGWPGLGRLYIQALNTLDYPVVMAVVMALGIGTVVMNIVADFAYGFLDPRVRLE